MTIDKWEFFDESEYTEQCHCSRCGVEIADASEGDECDDCFNSGINLENYEIVEE